MKNISILLVMAVMMVSTVAFAESTDANKHPCKAIQTACASAGFTRGGHKNGGKGIFVDCLGPILKGQTVQGVSVDASVVQACQARKEKRKEARGGQN